MHLSEILNLKDINIISLNPNTLRFIECGFYYLCAVKLSRYAPGLTPVHFLKAR